MKSLHFIPLVKTFAVLSCEVAAYRRVDVFFASVTIKLCQKMPFSKNYGIFLKDFSFFSKSTWILPEMVYSTSSSLWDADVAEWQTRCVQVAVRLRGWRFKSFRRHHFYTQFYIFAPYLPHNSCKSLFYVLSYVVTCQKEWSRHEKRNYMEKSKENE